MLHWDVKRFPFRLLKNCFKLCVMVQETKIIRYHSIKRLPCLYASIYDVFSITRAQSLLLRI